MCPGRKRCNHCLHGAAPRRSQAAAPVAMGWAEAATAAEIWVEATALAMVAVVD